MVKIRGVETRQDSDGKITHVTIDIQQHKEAVPILKELGLMEKTQFEKDCEGAITLEELRTHLKEHVRKVWNK